MRSFDDRAEAHFLEPFWTGRRAGLFDQRCSPAA